MSYSGLSGVINENSAHLGGNVLEGDPFTHAPSVWDYLTKRFAIQSVLDLGSGMGYSAHYFNKLGLKVLAVDGLWENCMNAIYPTLQLDLTKSKVVTRVDLVHCQEVVEHIEEEFLDNLLASLACGRIIVMTNALPGQGGHHHVNEQPTNYWIEHLRQHKCEVLVEDSNRVRQLAKLDGAHYLAQTGVVFANQNYHKNLLEPGSLQAEAVR
jgi:SAM-dependent methyltransferase